MTWTDALPDLTAEGQRRLQALPERHLPKGQVLFRLGDAAAGYVIVLSGRIEVFLTGPSGREILLYAVEPGQSCVQTTLGLMGDEPYSGEAITATEVGLVMIPKPLFLGLMDADRGFRGHVLHSFAQRMQDVTRLLERVAFVRIESRLAAMLLDLAEGGRVQATQAELAARIGSAREVVTRRLDALARAGLVATERGEVRLCDPAGLRRLAAQGLSGTAEGDHITYSASPGG
jgi:CRP/FNR family transcriptional regulator